MIDREYDVRAYEEGYRAGKHDAQGENEKLLAALRFYAEGEWSDGYPGGVKIDDNTLDFGDIARAALEGREPPIK